MNIARVWTVIIAFFGVAVFTQAQLAKRLPVEDFFVEDDYTSMKLSPDGKNLAFLTTLGTGKVGIALLDLTTGKTEALVAAKDENIKFYFWKGNDYIVYGGDIGGNEAPSLRSITIAPRKGGKRQVVNLSESGNYAYVIEPMRYHPYEIILNAGYNYRIDVRTGRGKRIGRDEDMIDGMSIAFDHNGEIRARSRYEGKNMIYEIRSRTPDLFTKIAEFPADDPKWEFLDFAGDNETLYLISRERLETGELYSLHLPTKKLSKPLFGLPDGEVNGVLLSYDGKKFYGVNYITDRIYEKFSDVGRERLQRQIDESLPGSQNFIVSTSADEKKLVVRSSNDRDPGTYYLLDLTRPSMSIVGKVNRRIDPAQMAEMEPIQFQARDGLMIHGYLTRPLGSAGKKIPLIINPHGGPFGIRDTWGFNGEVQFLANRGYAVLQINYRGSGGYGRSFQKAGQREWGGKMQDDLTDGVKWAIAQGFVDPARIAIYGASYGGYAALAGVTFTPELYCCAVNYVGVSDLSRMQRLKIYGHRGNLDFLKDWLGTDKTYLHDRSPVNFVDRIRVPTLHAYGLNDPRVDIDHWKRLETKLKQYNKPYEIMIMKDEGHGFYNEKNRIDFYRRMEKFLDTNLTQAVNPPAIAVPNS